MIPEGMITELVRRGGDLFTEAVSMARQHRLIVSSPLVLTRACKAKPLCKHCSWRGSRGLMKQYAGARVSTEEAALRAGYIEQSGAARVNLVSGWMKQSLPPYFYECIAGIRKHSGLEICANFGAVSKPDLAALKEAGVDSVSCALETTNLHAFQDLKPGDNYEARLQTLKDARKLGFKICTNFIIGIGETLEDIDESIRLAETLGIRFLSFSCLQPTPFTETETWERPKPYYVGRIGAAARICLGDVDIGISFDATNDLIWGMRCGANAFTLALRNPKETPELLGDDVSRLHTMWHDSQENGGN